ncbi:phospholipase D family nuclease [Effusibacillus pohliae]|uniref:phospholipase D family nuclease n=1 Tax=Effusibacillus pohliae TaxID=232270 RepID=UPI000A02B5E8|nr:phospholipase D family protein [Effusibacillus pohliae]
MSNRLKIMAMTSAIALFFPGCAPVDHAVSADRSKSDQTRVEYAFTQADQHPETLLKNVIDSAKSSLDIAIYSITKDDIRDAIIAAKKRGVKVRMITDHQEAQGKYQAEDLKRLREAGIPIKENTHSGLMHLKVTIADQSLVTTGSYNYTVAASTTNDEVLVVLRDPSIAKDWEKQFERMWEDTKNFTDIK